MSSDKLSPTQTNGNGHGTKLIEKNLEPEIETSAAENTPEEEEFVQKTEGVMDIPEKTLKAFGGDDLRARVFYEKYALRDKTGRIVELTPEDMWRRVAREIASPEKSKEMKKEWEDNFYWLLSNFKFIPGGRILRRRAEQTVHTAQLLLYAHKRGFNRGYFRMVQRGRGLTRSAAVWGPTYPFSGPKAPRLTIRRFIPRARYRSWTCFRQRQAP
jgi:hypothetical protein